MGPGTCFAHTALFCCQCRHDLKGNDSMKWITRERVKVDRVACPWLIKKFVDREAEFLFSDPPKSGQSHSWRTSTKFSKQAVASKSVASRRSMPCGSSWGS